MLHNIYDRESVKQQLNDFCQNVPPVEACAAQLFTEAELKLDWAWGKASEHTMMPRTDSMEKCQDASESLALCQEQDEVPEQTARESPSLVSQARTMLGQDAVSTASRPRKQKGHKKEHVQQFQEVRSTHEIIELSAGSNICYPAGIRRLCTRLETTGGHTKADWPTQSH